MDKTYEYFKSVFMPFAYIDTKYFPDIPYKGLRGGVTNLGVDQTYTVPPGENVEAILISPCLITGGVDSSYSEVVSFFSKLNPTATGDLHLRYNTSDSINMSVSNQVAMYLHKACGFIHATGPVTYEACMFVKTLATTSQTPDEMFSLHTKTSGVLQPSDKFWINTLPVYFEKRSFDSSSNTYRPGVSVHYLIRITNNGTSNATVYVKGGIGNTVGERDTLTTDNSAWVIKSSPLGFTQYVLEKLRSKHCFMVLNNSDATAVATKKAEIEADIKLAINELAQDWYDMLKAIPGIDLSRLINFIIFYLE